MNMLAPLPAFPSGSRVPGRVSTHVRQLAEKTLWVTMNPNPETSVQNFTPDIVAEFGSLIETLKRSPEAFGGLPSSAPAYAVIQSSHPAYFSQGGDLSFFLECIRDRDAKQLYDYSIGCLDVLHGWSTGFKDRMTTIALLEGRALGGGFELALSADCVVATEGSSFGFPEIMFGLFPCTGAMGLLTQRVSPRMAERMMTNKRIYTARELFDMGIVDEICQDGEGVLAVERFIENHAKRRKSRLKVQQARQRFAGLDYEEGVRVVEDWVETAMQLSQDEIRSMEMLIMMQQGELQAAREARLAA